MTIRNEIETCIVDGKYGKDLSASLVVPGSSTVDKGYPCASLEHTAVVSELLGAPGYHTVEAKEQTTCRPLEGRSNSCAREILYVIEGKLRQDGSRSVAAYLKSGEDGGSGVTVAITRYNDDQWKCTITNVNDKYPPIGCNAGGYGDIRNMTL
ncbi:MAG: pilin [Zoogloeaceae bacterium]|nr:pilin [Zoogloeaceae bacterium]